MKKVLIFLIILIIGLIGFYFSPYSKDLLKKYVQNNMCFGNKFKVDYFNYTINSFSMKMHNLLNNNVSLVGNFYPFSGTYEAHINDLSFINPLLKGNMVSSGNFTPHYAEGNLIIANGIGKLNLTCNNDKVRGNIVLKDVDFSAFFNMIKNFKLPISSEYLKKGKSDLNIQIGDTIVANGEFRGKVNVLGNDIDAIVDLKNMKISTNDNIEFDLLIKANELKGIIKGNNGKDSIEYKGNFDYFDLKLLREFLLYPVTSKVPLNFTYNKIYDNIFFKFNGFSGYYQKGKINIQFKEDYKTFFKILNIKPILSGDVSGNISVMLNNKRGTFDFLFKNSNFLNYDLFKKLEELTHINLHSSKDIFFVNGSFDSDKVYFELYNKNPKYKIFMKKGEYNYKTHTLKIFIIISNKDSLFKIKVFNNNVKLISRKLFNPRKETLVQ